MTALIEIVLGMMLGIIALNCGHVGGKCCLRFWCC